MTGLTLLVVLDAALLGLGLLADSQCRPIPASSIYGAVGLLVAWQVALFWTGRRRGAPFRVEPFFHSTHYVQGFLQAAIYAYVWLYWDEIGWYAPLILAQIVVAYLCDILLSWSRGRAARVGFAVMPVVLSTNLFLWFKEDYFYCQLLMVALAFFAKEFLTWNYGGRRHHIFNPSAFPLAVVSLLLLVTGHVGMTRGADLVVAFELCPNFYEVVFLLGVVTQALFLTAAVSFGAVAALCLLFVAGQLTFGQPLTTTPISPQVFLGLTFLVTDPASSPRSTLGRFLFGFAYGVGVFALLVLLRWALQPSYFDKLLVVPVVNLLVPLFDWASDWLEKTVVPVLARCPGLLVRLGWLGAYVGLFVLIDPTLKAPRETAAVLPRPVLQQQIDEKLTIQYMHKGKCMSAFPRAYKPFGLWDEFANLAEIRLINRHGSSTDARLAPSRGGPYRLGRGK